MYTTVQYSIYTPTHKCNYMIQLKLDKLLVRGLVVEYVHDSCATRAVGVGDCIALDPAGGRRRALTVPVVLHLLCEGPLAALSVLASLWFDALTAGCGPVLTPAEAHAHGALVLVCVGLALWPGAGLARGPVGGGSTVSTVSSAIRSEDILDALSAVPIHITSALLCATALLGRACFARRGFVTRGFRGVGGFR